MPNLFNTTVIMIYCMPLLGLLLGILPALFVWYVSRRKRSSVKQKTTTEQVNNGFTLLL